jgi:hypothetical protein
VEVYKGFGCGDFAQAAQWFGVLHNLAQLELFIYY